MLEVAHYLLCMVISVAIAVIVKTSVHKITWKSESSVTFSAKAFKNWRMEAHFLFSLKSVVFLE